MTSIPTNPAAIVGHHFEEEKRNVSWDIRADSAESPCRHRR